MQGRPRTSLGAAFVAAAALALFTGGAAAQVDDAGDLCADALDSGEGPDELFAAAGDDSLDAGEWNDILDAAAGTDVCLRGESLAGCESDTAGDPLAQPLPLGTRPVAPPATLVPNDESQERDIVEEARVAQGVFDGDGSLSESFLREQLALQCALWFADTQSCFDEAMRADVPDDASADDFAAVLGAVARWGADVNCDEFPNWAMERARPGASIRYMPGPDSRREGTNLNVFFRACPDTTQLDRPRRIPFLVVPTPLLPTSFHCGRR